MSTCSNFIVANQIASSKTSISTTHRTKIQIIPSISSNNFSLGIITKIFAGHLFGHYTIYFDSRKIEFDSIKKQDSCHNSSYSTICVLADWANPMKVDTRSSDGVLPDWANPTEVDLWSNIGVLPDWHNPTEVDAQSTNGVLDDWHNPT